MRAMASSRGSTPESAKKQACMMVLMRPPMPASRGHRVGVDHEEPQAAAPTICCCTSRGRWSQTSSGGVGRVQEEDRARGGALQHVELLQELELVAGHEARACGSGRSSGWAAARSAGARP